MARLAVLAATRERAAEIAAVMGDCADASRCWCAFWSLPRAQFERGSRDGGNRRWFMQRLDASERPPGVLAHLDGSPAGWCAVAPRAELGRLARSRNLAAVDALPVWSITCFVIAKRFRRQGLMRALIDGAAAFARAQGATTLEAYPVDPQRASGAGELYTGLLSTFLAAGFEEVERRAPLRPIVRRVLRRQGAPR